MIRTVAGYRRDQGLGAKGQYTAARRPFWTRLSLIVITCLTLHACTNSKFVVGYFYDRLDNKILEAANEWLNPTAAQRAELRALIGTFHTWHRRTQLPLYAQTLRDMTASIALEAQTAPEDFDRWIQAVRGHLESIRQCDPAPYSVPVARTLSAAQIDQAEARWKKERAENAERFGSRTRKERIAHRVERLGTWAGRLGLDLTDEQLALYKDTLTRQTSLSKQMRVVSGEWTAALFAIARQPEVDDYAERMNAHLAARFGLMEDNYPHGWSRNRNLWRDFAIKFEKTLSKKQRRDATRWLNKLAASLEGVSRNTPDWLPADDPDYGCVVASKAGKGGNAG